MSTGRWRRRWIGRAVVAAAWAAPLLALPAFAQEAILRTTDTPGAPPAGPPPLARETVLPEAGVDGGPSSVPVPARPTVPIVTLDDAIALALEHSPSAVAAGGATSTARAALTQSRMAWLPSVSLNSAYSNSSNERFDQSTGTLVSQNYSAQLAASYELFSGGRWLAQHRNTLAVLAAAESREHAQRFGAILAVKRAFFAASAASELVASAEQRLERARQQYSFAETRLELGTATRSDLLRADLEVGGAELALLEAQSDLHATRLELGRQIGQSHEVQPAAAALRSTAPALPAFEELAREAEAGAPDVLAAQADLIARSANVRASYASYLPSLRLTGGYDWAAFHFPPSEQSWSLRLVASLPLFNGWQRETTVAQARVQEQVARAGARDAAIGARVAAEVAARQVQTSEQRVRIAERAVELAAEDLRVQVDRYQLGNATILDLQASQGGLTDAETAAIQARYSLAVAIGELETILGRVLEGL